MWTGRGSWQSSSCSGPGVHGVVPPAVLHTICHSATWLKLGLEHCHITSVQASVGWLYLSPSSLAYKVGFKSDITFSVVWNTFYFIPFIHFEQKTDKEAIWVCRMMDQVRTRCIWLYCRHVDVNWLVLFNETAAVLFYIVNHNYYNYKNWQKVRSNTAVLRLLGKY